MTIGDIMHAGDELPMVDVSASLKEAIVEMSQHRLGVTGVAQDGKLIACITDGDLRRILQAGDVNLDAAVKTLAHPQPRTIKANHLASEALHMMETHKLTTLFVVADNDELQGIVHLHDLLQAGVA